MNLRKCSTNYWDLRITLVFMFGIIVGVVATHSTGSWLRDIGLVILATSAFHLTHCGQLKRVKNQLK